MQDMQAAEPIDADDETDLLDFLRGRAVEKPARPAIPLVACLVSLVIAVGATASVLVAHAPTQLWWLWLLAILSYGLALLGYLAPRHRCFGWRRIGIHS